MSPLRSPGARGRCEVGRNLPKRGGNIMRKFSVILALLALLFTDIALAAGAIVTSITGTATVQAGTAPARALRQGDEVKQGETVKTAVASAVVMRFDDG